MFQVYSLIHIYSVYREYRAGTGDIRTLDEVRYFLYISSVTLFQLFQEILEDGSEIASARVSSIFRKSMKKSKLTNKQVPQERSVGTLPLSKICEEDTENKSANEKQRMKDKHNDDTFVVVENIVTGDEKQVRDLSK